MTDMLNNWRLSRKMMGAFLILAVLMVGLGVTGIVSTKRLSAVASRHVSQGIVGAEALGQVVGRVREHRIIVFSQLNTVTPDEIASLDDRFAKNREKLAQALDDFGAVAGEFAPQLAQLRADVAKVEAVNAQTFATKKRDGAAAALPLIKGPGKEASQAAIKHTEELMALTNGRALAQDAAGRAAADTALYLSIALFGIAMIALFAIWRLITTTVAGPLAELSTVTNTLAAGGEATVPHRARADEIGKVAEAVELFRAAAVARAAEEKRIAADQKHVVDTVSAHLSRLSDGDLTAQIAADFPGKYVGLKTTFNDALAKLRDLIGAVSESAVTIRTGSSEIAQASEDLARRTESNAASLEETAAAIAQMDNRLRATTEAARTSAAGSRQAMVAVADGRSRTDEAVQAMGRVSESAKGIDSVIEGLDKIAFQTRVLAMNAAVEAGRAGDAGRGFAVVADLVSALAMRAEEEAKNARGQLTVTQTDIVAAVDAVGKVDQALIGISESGAAATGLIEQIAADNQAQSAAITQISVAIGTMDQATQQNAAMVEQTSAAARNLAGEVGGLAEQASRFTIDAGGARAPAGGSRKLDVARFAGPTRPLPAAAVSALTRPAASGDDWNEF